MTHDRRSCELFRALGFAALSGACWGCSSDEAGADPCNAVVNNGPTVMALPADTGTSPPAAMGGEIAEGRYVLVAITYYGDAASLPSREFQFAFEIEGHTMRQVSSIDDEESRYTSTFSTSGTTFTTRDSCPVPLTSRFEYTATPEAFFIYDERAGAIMEQQFELRD